MELEYHSLVFTLLILSGSVGIDNGKRDVVNTINKGDNLRCALKLLVVSSAAMGQGHQGRYFLNINYAINQNYPTTI